MTVEEKKHRIAAIGGDWAELMRRSLELREALSAAVREATAMLDSHSAEAQGVGDELFHHARQHEHLLDRIREIARLTRTTNSPRSVPKDSITAQEVLRRIRL